MTDVSFDDLVPKTSVPKFDDLIPKARPYVSTKAFDISLDQTLGRGRWRDTGDYRSPARENQLRTQGAATVAPGHLSAHSRGTPDAPGAHDIVIPGMPLSAAAERLRKVPGVKDVIPEGRAGSQGPHLHVDVGAAPVTFDDLVPKTKPVSFDDLVPKKATGSAFKAVAGRPEVKPEPDPGARRRGEAVADLKKIASTPTWNPIAEGVRELGDITEIPLSYVGGMAEKAARAGGKAVAGKDYRDPEYERKIGDIAEGVVPIPGAGEVKAGVKAAEEVGAAGSKVAQRLAKLGEHEVIGREAHPIERIDNAFYRAGGRATSGKIEAKQAVKALPKEVRNAKVQEELTHTLEERLKGKPKVPGKLVDTRGKGQWYHGSKEPIANLHENYYSPHNIYGGYDTFYTTDAADIAGGYGRKSPSAAIHTVDEKVPVKHYDMEQPHDLAHWNKFFRVEDDDLTIEAEAVENAVHDHKTPNLRQVMDEIRGISREHGYSKDDVQEIFASVTDRLQAEGYGGMTHKGGLQTGRSPHTVKIYFSPSKQLSLRRIDPEREMVEGAHPDLPEHLKAAEAARQPWAERQRKAVNEIRTMLKERGLTDKEIEDYAPSSETGYIPRRVVGRSPGFDPRDPAASGRNPLAWKKQATQTTTSSLKARQFKILTNQEGKSFLHEGEAPETDIKGRPYASVRPATIKEIEAQSDVRYHKNATANTIDEALRAERVLDNLKVLDETTKQAATEGLAHRAEWRFKGADGLTNVARSNKPTPQGFKEIADVPALKGWTFAPELHQLLSDVLPKEREPLENIIATVNRAINASLFITPIPHIKNVATMAFIGRGWDNLNLWRGGKTTGKAIAEVLKLGPEYRAWLREGAGMQAGDEATRNFYESMLKAFGTQIENSVETKRAVAAALGVNPVALVKGLYKVSHQALWNVNDMIMFQRYLELKEKGFSARDAIKETEKWVANYRIPPQVLKSRAFQQFISNGVFVNFGRFEYGKLKAIGEMVKRVKDDPIDAAGKIAALGFLGAIAYPVMNEAARKVTGNKNAYITPGGQMNALESGADMAAREAGFHPHLTAREKDWAGTMAAFLTPAPAMQAASEVESGRYGWSGQPIVDPRASKLGKTVQRGEYAASKFYPAELAVDATKPGGLKNVGAALVGVNMPQSGGKPKASTERRLTKQAKRHEQRDPTENLVRSFGFK